MDRHKGFGNLREISTGLSYSGWREQSEFWINGKLFKDRYGLGDTTRKKRFQELVELGILEVVEWSVAGREGTRTFRRNVYVVADPFRADSAPASTSSG